MSQNQSKMVKFNEAVEKLIEVVTKNNHQKAGERSSAYQYRISHLADEFIRGLLIDDNIPMTLVNFNGGAMKDAFKVEFPSGHYGIYSLSKSEIDLQQLLELAKDHFISTHGTIPQEIATASGTIIISNDSIDLELWKKAIDLVVGCQLEKSDAAEKKESKHSYLTGSKTWPYKTKIVYRVLKYIDSGCKCISLALEKIVLADMTNEAADFTDEQIQACKGTPLEGTSYLTNGHRIPEKKIDGKPEKDCLCDYFKKTVKLAMRSNPDAKTRIYKGWEMDGKTRIYFFNTNWHKIKCTIHPDASNAAPPKKTKTQ